MALGVVKGDDEIPLPCHVHALLDEFPRRQEIREADDREIMHERRPEQGRRCIDRRYASNGPIVFRTLFPRHLQQDLQHETSHAIDAGIPAGNDHGFPAVRRGCDCHATAVDFLHHARADDVFPLEQRRDELDVGMIACHHLRVLDGRTCTRRHIEKTSRTDSYDCNVCHTKATVTFLNFVFPSASLPRAGPASASAAASATLPTPMVFLTKGDSCKPYRSTMACKAL